MPGQIQPLIESEGGAEIRHPLAQALHAPAPTRGSDRLARALLERRLQLGATGCTWRRESLPGGAPTGTWWDTSQDDPPDAAESSGWEPSRVPLASLLPAPANVWMLVARSHGNACSEMRSLQPGAEPALAPFLPLRRGSSRGEVSPRRSGSHLRGRAGLALPPSEPTEGAQGMKQVAMQGGNGAALTTLDRAAGKGLGYISPNGSGPRSFLGPDRGPGGWCSEALQPSHGGCPSWEAAGAGRRGKVSPRLSRVDDGGRKGIRPFPLPSSREAFPRIVVLFSRT